MALELYTYCRDTDVLFVLALALACARAVVSGSMQPSVSPECSRALE